MGMSTSRRKEMKHYLVNNQFYIPELFFCGISFALKQ